MKFQPLRDRGELFCSVFASIATVFFYSLVHTVLLFLLRLVSSAAELKTWASAFILTSLFFASCLLSVFLLMALALRFYLRKYVAFKECLYMIVLSSIYCPLLSVLFGFYYVPREIVGLLAMPYLFVADRLLYININFKKSTSEGVFFTYLTVIVLNISLVIFFIMFFHPVFGVEAFLRLATCDL